MARIFLSYSKRDHDLAEQVATLLRAEGLTIWWDEEITPREGWDRAIEREIAAADHVLALWTANSVESDWVRIEANYARNCRPSKLVQARFDQSDVPIAFSLIQFVDLDRANPAQSPDWRRLIGWLEQPGSGCAPEPVAPASREAAPGHVPRAEGVSRPGPQPARSASGVAGTAIAGRDLPLFSGPFLYFTALAIFGSLRASGAGEETYELFGLPPAIYLTFLFTLPFLVLRRLALAEILYFAIGLPAAHCAAQGAAYATFPLLTDGPPRFEVTFVAGAIGGLAGAALGYGLFLLARRAPLGSYAWRQIVIAIMFLPLVGGAGLHFAPMGGVDTIWPWAILYLPWQLMFIACLVKVLNAQERARVAPAEA